MKKPFLFIFTLLLGMHIFPQVPQRLSYQAVIRNSNNTLASNQTVKLRISILKGSPTGEEVYVETHSATTNANGVVAIEIGGGTVVSGSFTNIKWADGPSFIKTETDPTGGDNYTLISTNQLLSVPYALVADKVSGTLPKLEVKGTTENMEEPLFEIKNKNGQTVFAVYNEGVRIYVDDGSKGTKGGFAIGGFGEKKGGYQDLFIVSPDSIRAYVDPGDEGKGTKGGFAIGSFSNSKSTRKEYFRVTNDSTRIYLTNSTAKGTKGGFAIGGFGENKGSYQNLLVVNPDSIRAYIDSGDEGKGTKGGFAIGSFSNSKSTIKEYLRVTNDSTRIYLANSTAKGTKGGFAIGGFGESKGIYQNLLVVNPDSIRAYIASGDEGKGTKGGFAIGTFSNDKSQPHNLMFINQDSSMFYLLKTDTISSAKFDIVAIDENNNMKSLLTANADTLKIQGVLNLQNNLVVSGNINIGGSIKQDALPVTDIDGNVYKTVLIGQQVWMAENLRTTRYRNGDVIGTTQNPDDDINGESEPKYQWAYDANEEYVPVYGRLYTWYAVTDPRNICPDGFHVPSNNEFYELTWYLYENNFGYEMDLNAIAKSLASTSLWTIYENPEIPFTVGEDQANNNATGFNAFPSGLRDNFSFSFEEMGVSANFWTSDTFPESQLAASFYSLHYNSSYFDENVRTKSAGLSVRCIKDK